MHLTEVLWSPPGSSENTDGGPSPNAKAALECAKAASKDFERDFEKIRDSKREQSVSKFDGEEVVISAHAIRFGSYTAEHELRTIRIIMDLHKGSFGGKSDHVRSRFADRSIDGHFSIRFLQPGLLDTTHGQNAATEIAREARILMNLAPHPNIVQCYGSNSDGLNALLGHGRKRFFIITDRISETLSDRIQRWKASETISATTTIPKIGDRIEVATDIASALLYLHSRKLVYYLRPDKVGFDTRHDRIKLVDFGQACPSGNVCLANSLTMSDNIRTLSYTAPEVLCHAPASTASDVYAFGMLLWEFMSLEHPFEMYDRPTHFQKVVLENERPKIPSSKGWPRPVCEIVENCWDPSLRPTLSMVNESLEVALLFSEHETQEVKNDFRAVRRQSSSSNKALSREASSRRFSAYSTASPKDNGDHTPSRPRRVVRRKSDEPVHSGGYASPHSKTSPRNDVDPQRSSQSTPGGVHDRVRKSKKGAVRVARSTSLRVVGDTPDGGKAKRVIRVRSGSLEKKESVPLVLAKLGLKLDDEEATSQMTSTQTPTSAPSWSSGSDEEGDRRPVRRRRSKQDDSQNNEGGALKTPRRRSNKRDERQNVLGNKDIVPKTPNRRTQLRRSNSKEMVPCTPPPRRREGRDKKTSPTTSSSSSSPSGGSTNTQRRKSGRKAPFRTSSRNPPPVRGQVYRCNSFESVFSTEQDNKKPPQGRARRPTPAQNLQRYASARDLTTNSADLLAELVGNLSVVPKHDKIMPIVPSGCQPASPKKSSSPIRRMLRRGSA